MILPTTITAQDDPYIFTFAPDVWYNDVDGIRIGIRTLGEVEGTFKDGPHRLDAGLWIGTWMPDNPISYYLSFTEPIKSISDISNEGSIQLISSIRTGYSRHKIQFNKRWQPGFDEYDYKELAISFSREELLDIEYRPFPAVWQNQAKALVGGLFIISQSQNYGQFLAGVEVQSNLNRDSSPFTVATLEAAQRFDLNTKIKLRIRAFAGLSTDDVAPEYRFLTSMDSPINWLDNGVSRSKGTISRPWLEAGSFHVGGGANLRGYVNRDIAILKNSTLEPSNSTYSIYQSIWALNTEIEFSNFIDNYINTISIFGDLMELRSYLFLDVGKGTSNYEITSRGGVGGNFSSYEYEDGILANAGTGIQLSINIPDYLAKDRGIFIRYDIPFWLSNPTVGESNFSFRQLIGFGAIISF